MKPEIIQHKKTVEIPKDVSQRQWMFGDFDKDGVKNIDDKTPLDQHGQKFGPMHSHKAEFSTRESLLSDELMRIEDYNNLHGAQMNIFLRKQRHGRGTTAHGRIKSVPSTIGKMRRRYLYTGKVHDVAGATIEVNKRKDVNRVEGKIKKRYPIYKNGTDDYYKKPKGGVYYAKHLLLRMGTSNVTKHGQPSPLKLELQLKTHKMALLQAKMHESYKKGELSPLWRERAHKLFKKGY
jgi:ppGpp synthetase/RelA/SpoT-type nucleotidyltranferase